MTGKEDSNSTGSKDDINEAEGLMNRYTDMMHDLYLKFSHLLITLSVAAIGFAASYILGDGYHSGKYETILAYTALICLSVGCLLLIVSCLCGLWHLRITFQLIQRAAEYFAKNHGVAIGIDCQTPTDVPTAVREYEKKNKYISWLWWLQTWLFFGGIILIDILGRI